MWEEEPAATQPSQLHPRPRHSTLEDVVFQTADITWGREEPTSPFSWSIAQSGKLRPETLLPILGSAKKGKVRV